MMELRNVYEFSSMVCHGEKRGDRPRAESSDKSLFHQTSLIALFAWVGLGADGLSSSCYGPEAAFCG